MFAALAHIRPLDPRTGNRVDVRVASTPSPASQGLGGFVWESAMVRRPRGSIELFALDLSAGTRTATSDFAISLPGIQEIDASALNWAGAPVTIYRGDDLAWPAPVEFDGNITKAQQDLGTDVLAITAQVSTKMLEMPLLTAEFDGGGGIGGDPDKRTVLKPAGFGICLNLEPVLFDATYNVYMLDGYANLLSVEWAAEGLSSLGPSVGDFADYAALIAAIDAGIVAPGRWATSIADGIIGLGAPPTGVITCNATFGYGMTGALMRRATVLHAEVPADKLVDASFDAIDADLPYPIHYWTATQIQVKELNEILAAACNASPIVTFQGGYGIVRPFGGQSLGVLNRAGLSEPAIRNWKTNGTVTPYWQIKGRAARPVRVMDFDEINYSDSFVDRGLYDPDTTYRDGNIVWLRNKSQWLYINETPDKGHEPPDGTEGDEWWERLAPAPDASDLTYQDGTPIEDLQPDEAGSQISRSITLSETSKAFTINKAGTLIAGQLPYTFRATMSAANYDVTRATNWSITPSAGITATIDNDVNSPYRGEVEIQAVTQAGTIEVQGVNGNVTQKQTFTITTKGILSDLSEIGSGNIEVGAVTGSASFTGPDVPIGPDEVTIIETPAISLGDAVDGRGIFLVTMNHDSSEQVDTWCALRTYADMGTGSGFQEILPLARQGVKTGNGNTYWGMRTAYSFSISSTNPIKIRITMQGITIGGGGNTSGSIAKQPRIDLFTGER